MKRARFFNNGLGRVLLMAALLEFSVMLSGCRQFASSPSGSATSPDRATVSTQSSGDPLPMQPVTTTALLAGKDAGGAEKPNARSPLGINRHHGEQRQRTHRCQPSAGA